VTLLSCDQEKEKKGLAFFQARDGEKKKKKSLREAQANSERRKRKIELST
jgi:hypothetical protein